MSDITEVPTERLRELRDWCFAAGGWHTVANDLRALRDLKVVIDEALHLRTLSPAAQGRKPPGPLESPSAGLSPDEYRLRKMLAFSYSGSNLYGDDGELQDSASPFPIDYMRDTVEQIETAIYNRGMAALAKHQAALSTDTTEQPRSVQRRIAAQKGLPAPDFSAPAAGWWETPMQMCICADPENCTEVPEGRICKRATPAPAEQAGDQWVPWKAGDPAPMPCFHTQYLCSVRRMGTIDPVWLAIRDGHMFDDGTSTEVVAYQRAPLPAPFAIDAAIAKETTK